MFLSWWERSLPGWFHPLSPPPTPHPQNKWAHSLVEWGWNDVNHTFTNHQIPTQLHTNGKFWSKVFSARALHHHCHSSSFQYSSRDLHANVHWRCYSRSKWPITLLIDFMLAMCSCVHWFLPVQQENISFSDQNHNIYKEIPNISYISHGFLRHNKPCNCGFLFVVAPLLSDEDYPNIYQ